MRGFLLIALAGLTTGCTNDQPVEARAAGDTLEFVATGTSADANCLSSLRVGRARQETLWEIEAQAADGTRAPCAARLPLRYGVVPPGFRTIVFARPLTPGTTYDLIGTGGRFLRGAFHYAGAGRAIENFRPNSPEWCTAQYPGSTPDWLGQCRIR